MATDCRASVCADAVLLEGGLQLAEDRSDRGLHRALLQDRRQRPKLLACGERCLRPQAAVPVAHGCEQQTAADRDDDVPVLIFPIRNFELLTSQRVDADIELGRIARAVPHASARLEASSRAEGQEAAY